METNWKEAECHTTEYPILNLTCTYKEFVEFIEEIEKNKKRDFPISIISNEDGDSFEIRLPSKEGYENIEKTFHNIEHRYMLFAPLIRFEVLSRCPLSLKPTHYWIINDAEAQERAIKFFKLINDYYERVDTVGVVEKPALPEKPPIKGDIVNDSEDEIINQIKDHLWDREAVRMWRAGNSGPEIARAFFVTRERVNNRLSELRQIYGEKIVEYDEQRRTRLLKKTRDSA
jgi:hypothetical protein